MEKSPPVTLANSFILKISDQRQKGHKNFITYIIPRSFSFVPHFWGSFYQKTPPGGKNSFYRERQEPTEKTGGENDLEICAEVI